MIDNPSPYDWKELQQSVHRLFSEIGLTSEVEKKVKTPRGEVEIDVWAIDENSVDKICYVVECKNWSTAVPQTVVHSFTTVMHETGGNIGFIVTKAGLQSGAKDYLKNTNIIGMTYLQLQDRYIELWWKKCFMLKIGSSVDTLVQYVEPINSRRERFLKALPDKKQKQYANLLQRYRKFGMLMALLVFPMHPSKFDIPAPDDIDSFKKQLRFELGDEFAFKSEYYRDLADEICLKIDDVTKQFNNLFGSNIFY
ncbi:MAG: restriction endonuclease [Sulfuricurvum sp.]|uniref:restriction endonuclease n=1 Tax=Sulfuricurvum sp. TaxID=2025608 RepID=UPI0027358931|nr:restriction endonuclease [Sulfuricurvum sp.]MDP3292816.1 restriction endonuclease [Sulfuricurvum sp.]